MVRLRKAASAGRVPCTDLPSLLFRQMIDVGIARCVVEDRACDHFLPILRQFVKHGVDKHPV